ncbi:MAG: hypothetical protein HY919_02900 [Elusimicrobia bacterium]|nr:hypothetical protein [Elusimicrobiota bacterium]
MHPILSKLFQKRGIKDYSELSPEEKKDFDSWKLILDKDELSLGDILKFCNSQIEMIESKWRDLNLEQQKKAELIPYHTCYKTLAGAIQSPKVVREMLEKQLLALIK